MAKSYEASGVNLEAGYEVVSRIKKHVASTVGPGCMGGIGAFGGMFDLGSLGYRHPVLVSGTDGVGTKLKIAFELDRHDTIGIDAVAMCVNDVLAQGAQPLLFLDYVAVGHNRPEVVEAIVSGVAEGCRQAGCALVGGETAEMPGMYAPEDYDIAGFTVGAVEKDELIDGSKVAEGDVLVGLPSTGVHSNGFSLVRKIVSDAGLDLNARYEETGDRTLGEVLLTPTAIYVKAVLELMKQVDGHGVAKDGSWKIPPVFDLLRKYGDLPRREMFNIFNMGIGMVVAVSASDAEKAVASLKSSGIDAAVIGKVVKGSGVTLV